MQKREIPVYLFLGFLESGKSSFIQETLEDHRFNDGEPTLLLLCEEGEVEYDPSRFASRNVEIAVVDAPEQLTEACLAQLLQDSSATRVLVEYNGMWMLDPLFDAMPEEWVIYQSMMFADARTFVQFDRNMRPLVGDKLKETEMVVFNRMTTEQDKLPLHQIARSVSRSALIVYEYPGGRTEEDDIEDPLPFDLDAPVVEIKDGDYAHWYRDIMEEQDKYHEKILQFKGLVVISEKLPKNYTIAGRHVMVCCEEDISFCGLVCRWPKKAPGSGGWAELKVKVSIEYNPVYKQDGPVLDVLSVKSAQPPEPKVADFY
ncbi:MAG: GTPase [Bacillota bacterium]|nr:GTPase [Bacillota bacterium]